MRSSTAQKSRNRVGRTGQQLRLIKEVSPRFGGRLLKNSHAKTARPLNTRQPIHLVLKSKIAWGERSMLHSRHKLKIEKLLERHAKKNGIKVYRFANSGNHLHILMRIHDAQTYKRFVRTVTGLIARQVLSAERGEKKLTAKMAKFWDARPFTEIITWGRQFKNHCEYLLLNNLEAIGFISHQPRGRGAKLRRSEIITLDIINDDDH